MTNKINLENMFSSFVLFLMCQISKCINALYPYNYLYMCICVYVLQAFLRRTPELAGPPHIVTLFIPPLPTANLCLFSKTCLMQELSNQSLQCACTLQWRAPRWEPCHAEAHVLLGQGEKMANQPVGQTGLSPRAEGTLLEQEGSHRELRWPCVPMCRRSLVPSWNTEVKGWFSRLSQRETCLLLEYQQDSNKDHLH